MQINLTKSTLTLLHRLFGISNPYSLNNVKKKLWQTLYKVGVAGNIMQDQLYMTTTIHGRR